MTERTGVITKSTRTTPGAFGELVVVSILGAGIGFLILLGIAACGGLQLLAEVAR